MPQLGCRAACCDAVRKGLRPRRLAASLLIADERSGQRWLLDASPDLRAQEEYIHGIPLARHEEGPRPPLVDGVLLTHAHLGHLAGLLHFGREAMATRALPVWCAPRLAELLRSQAPWRLLVDEGHIDVRVVEHEMAIALNERIRARAILVPHRGEFSETLAWRIECGTECILYCPDIDRFDAFPGGLTALLDGCTTAFLDGTFFALDEVPGRSIENVPHPPVSHTLALLARLPASRPRILFTHLNHSNPLNDAHSVARRALEAAGAGLVHDGDTLCFD